jgi:hypothetical protein
MKTIEYLGLQCVELSNHWVTLWVTQSVGPRIIALKANGGRNLFASLPDTTLECPGRGAFHLHGGHRLWHAPEDPKRTYLPDDAPVAIQPLENGLQVQQDVEAETGIQKSLKIQLQPGSASVIVEHHLANWGLWPVTCAPWAITQVRPGGVAFLPQNLDLIAQNPTLPNRNLALWPYTEINSPYITWGDALVLVRAEMAQGMLKIGFANPRGWLAYWLEGTLFIKRAAYHPGRDYYDFGSSSECYCNSQFLELETLGPVTIIEPGESAVHIETWEVVTGVPWPENPQNILDWIE